MYINPDHTGNGQGFFFFKQNDELWCNREKGLNTDIKDVDVCTRLDQLDLEWPSVSDQDIKSHMDSRLS
jgi:hypothetical protein